MTYYQFMAQKAIIREAIAAYGAAVAGTGDDLDEALESAALEIWRDEGWTEEDAGSRPPSSRED